MKTNGEAEFKQQKLSIEGYEEVDTLVASDLDNDGSEGLLLQSIMSKARQALGDGQTLQLLIKGVEAPSTGFEREHYIIELRKLDDKRVIPLLLDLLEVGKGVGYWASLAVAKLGDKEELIEPLTQKLQDPNPNVRLSAMSAFQYLAHTPLDPNSEEAWRLSASIVTHGAIDDRILFPLMILLDDSDPKVRAGAVSTLCHLGDQRATEKVCLALEDPIKDVRVSAAAFLGDFGDSRAIEPLVKAMESGDNDIRIRARQSLDFLGYEGVAQEMATEIFKAFGQTTPQAEAFAQEFLEKQESGNQEEISEMFQRMFNQRLIDSTGGVEEVIKKLKDPISSTRANAAMQLGLLKDERAVEPLIEALQDRDGLVRSNAISALRMLKAKKAVEPLLKLLQEKDGMIRYLVINALGDIGDKQAFEAVFAFLHDPNPEIKFVAIIATGQLGDERVLEPLLEYLKSDEAAIRKAAATALGALGDVEAIPALEWVRDNDREPDQEGDCVHRYAEEALENIKNR